MENDRQPPDPHARGARLLPPSLPPAPPSGGNLPPPGSGGAEGAGEPYAGRLFDALLECVHHLTVARTTFETRALFPDDPGLRREMDEIIRAARKDFAAQPHAIRFRWARHPAWIAEAELLSFRKRLLEPGRGRSSEVALPLLHPPEFVHAAALPPREFAGGVLRNLQDAAEHTFESETAAEFEARLGRPFEQVLHAATLAGIVP